MPRDSKKEDLIRNLDRLRQETRRLHEAGAFLGTCRMALQDYGSVNSKATCFLEVVMIMPTKKIIRETPLWQIADVTSWILRMHDLVVSGAAIATDSTLTLESGKEAALSGTVSRFMLNIMFLPRRLS